MKIRVGIKRESKILPNLFITTLTMDGAAASLMVAGFARLREELQSNGKGDIAKLIVCEYKDLVN